jgi:ribose transport system substrate-binding protein
MKRTPKWLAAGLLSVALLAACQGNPHKGEQYILVSTNINIPYWQQVKAGFTDSAAVIKVKAEMMGPTAYAPEEELKAFQDAVAAHPDGILVSVARPGVLRDAINAAVDAGIPVICVDSDSPQSKRLQFIGTNNYRAGIESANQMAVLLHERGQVLVVSIPGQDNQEERARGVADAFKKYPFLSVYKVVDDSGNSQTATQLVYGLLQNHERFDGVICLEASGGTGVAKALDQAGMSGKIPIVAMDANPETLDLISKGAIAATIAQKPYTMGYYGLRFLDDLHHNDVHEFPDWRTAPVSPLPAFVDTGTVDVNTQNLQDFLAAIQRPKV